LVCVLAAQRISGSPWPLEGTDFRLVVLAAASLFVGFLGRSVGWRLLFPAADRPNASRVVASVGAAAASGQVLPFRLDYAVKVTTLRRLGGKVLSFEAIAVSILALGVVDAVALLPLSIGAAAMTEESSFRAPLALVALFGVAATAFMLGHRRLLALPFLRRSRRLSSLGARLTVGLACRRSAAAAWLFLLGCWSTKAVGYALLLAAVGVGFSLELAIVLIVLSAAAAVIPLTSLGAVAHVGAGAAILIALGVEKGAAVDFSLAASMLTAAAAIGAALVGVAWAVAGPASARLSARVRALA
jgi:hypothetical protein